MPCVWGTVKVKMSLEGRVQLRAHGCRFLASVCRVVGVGLFFLADRTQQCSSSGCALFRHLLHMVLEGHKIREIIPGHLLRTLASLVAQIVKNLPAVLKTWV
ncbi:unnamed protein product [Rangifer tarandus platyrhynchus]|uniref:Uncharacterized protein n=1 Tax=Rangifer tarandus platyrhynchus TaxID=3082113 RepID=A0AC59ZR11_RANTA